MDANDWWKAYDKRRAKIENQTKLLAQLRDLSDFENEYVAGVCQDAADLIEILSDDVQSASDHAHRMSRY